MSIFPLLLLIFITPAFAEKGMDVCDILDLPNCSGVSKQKRRSSSMSLPSPAAATSINPATVSYDKGFGVETLFQANNPVAFNVASGTGKMGGALISQSQENSFFGNRVVELEPETLQRYKDNKRFKSRKLSFALGASLLRSRSFTLDVGMIFKRHMDIKTINTGFGISSKLGPFTLGASTYKDDFRLNFKDYEDPDTNVLYSIENNATTYKESFKVESYTAGVKIRDFTFDTGIIKTHYKFTNDDSKIFLNSASFAFKNLLFNLALRNEHSASKKFQDGKMVETRIKNEIYSGMQVSLNKHIILGLNYNYFLLREITASATLFF
ncbi:MAG: hypothetical protein AB7I27_06940 [Bacteriovoracaceae bacterium]